ncbi:Coatomer beta subunit [Parasponia andersonii]|uniref:Coatomer beta subunit n=1 Tax=Parasponia andersonii TaxID=3476 RepID=A0A2P5DY18_PARAD|nr:Coatomer beta subunit [Parasponia andersonii]
MGRNLNPILQQELKNLDKDADSRKAAMRALKSFVKDLDSKAIPLFIAEVSQKKEAGSLSGECTVSLYEILARVHGVKIVPLIDSIMTSIIKTLASSAGSFPLQQACSKVVPAIARYGIEPSSPEERKRHVIHSLCNPLLDSLLGSRESLTSGAALCLRALVENDNWRFASYEMVNKVCQNVAGALEENSAQTNALMGLVMALAKRNTIAVEPYARLLIQAGVRILNAGIEQGNSQKRLSAIQMINFLMKCLDPWSICSELQLIIQEMERCQSDQMAYVKGAALEALQTARRIAVESNFDRKDNGRRRFMLNAGDQSPSSMSPEPQILNSFAEYDSLINSPILSTQDIQYLNSDCRSVDRKLWKYENGAVNVSLKDGFFSGIAEASGISNAESEQSGTNKSAENKENYDGEFLGFSQSNLRSRISRSATSSPLDPTNMNSIFFEKQTRRSINQSPSDFEWISVSRSDQNCISPDDCECRDSESLNDDVERFQGGAESVSSTEDIPDEAGDIPTGVDLFVSQKVTTENKTARQKVALKLVCGLSFAILAALAPLLWLSSQDEGGYLVPT